MWHGVARSGIVNDKLKKGPPNDKSKVKGFINDVKMT